MTVSCTVLLHLVSLSFSTGHILATQCKWMHRAATVEHKIDSFKYIPGFSLLVYTLYDKYILGFGFWVGYNNVYEYVNLCSWSIFSYCLTLYIPNS